MKFLSLLSLPIAALFLTSCSTNQGLGTGIGAGLGAATGAIAGNNIDGISTGEGAVAGALVGGLIGNVQGRQQDQINQVRAENAAMNTTVVRIRNSNGSVSPIELRHVGGGRWQGPRGEIYQNRPSADQLYQAYGF